MTYQEATDLANRLESLMRRTDTFNKTREEILEEVFYVVQDLNAYARATKDVKK